MMTNDEILKIVLADIDGAKKAKKYIDDKIDTWTNEYNGELYGGETNGRSKMVVKDIKKAVESFVPNAVEPFVKKNRIVKLDGITADDVQRADTHERLLNYQFVRRFDRYSFIHDMFKVGATEGTTVIRCGWEFDEDVKKQSFDNVTQEQLAMFQQQGLDIDSAEDNGDGTFNVDASSSTTTKNNPTAVVIKNGDFFPDPTVDDIKDANFTAYRYEDTISNLKNSGKYKDEDLENLVSSTERSDSMLEQNRNLRSSYYGKDLNYESQAKANKKVTVYEYFGNIDRNEDGISEPLMVTVVDGKALEVTENPYPDGDNPFVVIQFSRTPFNIWGNPIAEFISDNQKIRTSLMRGFIDNVAQSNNGKKYIRKGAMDAVNKRKHEQNIGGVIEINGTKDDFFDGAFNPITPSVFNLYEIVNKESDSLSGVNRTMQGTDSSNLNDTATGASIQQSMGQKRMMEIIRRYSEGLKSVFRKWISYNKEFLSDKEVFRIAGQQIQFTRDDISGEFDIDITVGVDGVEEAKANQMTMLMQQIGGLQGAIDPTILNELLAKLADIWGFPDIAMKLEKPAPKQPNPMEQKMQQVEMAKADLEIEKIKAEIDKVKSESHKNMANANKLNVDAKIEATGINLPQQKEEAGESKSKEASESEPDE